MAREVQVQSYGYDLTIQWVTYQLDPAYAVLGTGYNQPEDVRVSSDGSFAYVTERTGNLLLVDLSNADRVNATVITSGMNAPQQLFFDENAGLAYTVEYADSGTLWRIDLTTAAMTAVLTGLDHHRGDRMVAVQPVRPLRARSLRTRALTVRRISPLLRP